MIYEIRKQFKFEYSHQLFKAYSTACSDCIHGHSAVVEVFFRNHQTDETGMVIDFGEISKLFKEYIDGYWDHALIMPDKFEKEYLDALAKYNKKLRIVDYNPTAEKMAKEMFNKFYEMLVSVGKQELLQGVRVHETATGWAEYKRV